MPELTQNLGLKKPLLDEAADIEVINENMDKIDEAIGIFGSGQAIHHATACTGTGDRYELVVPTLDYPLPDKFVLTFVPHAAVLDNAVIVVRKSAETPEEQSTVIPIVTNENEAIGSDAFAATTMVMLTVGGGRAFFKMGGKGKPPENWQFYEAITETGLWTSSKNQWIRVHVIGPGGTGGRGGLATQYTGESKTNSGGGGGGASGGGLAISTLYVKAGVSIACTLTTALTSFGDHGTALRGVNGGAGGAGKSNQWKGAGIGGIKGTPGGTASGGNIINKVGLDGINGGDGINYTDSTGPGVGAKGSPRLEGSPYYSIQAGENGVGKTLDGDVPTFGGGGGGGKGSNNYSTQNYQTGGVGAPGGIVIEIEAV